MKKIWIPLGVMNGLFCLLLAVAFGLAFIHVTDIPYRLEPFADETAMRNYRAAMRFLSPFVNEPFSLPDLSYSADGAQHFADCKSLFNGVYCLGLVSLVASAILVFILRKQNKRGFWLTSAGTTLIAPIVLSLYMAVDFDRVFVMFHKIFFNNNLWVFDPDMDPIIRILPKQFFMHCAVLIVLCIVLVALAEFVLWIRSNQIGISRTVPVGASLERV
jgi:integral membrane protein (TIGR01906 family)